MDIRSLYVLCVKEDDLKYICRYTTFKPKAQVLLVYKYKGRKDQKSSV